MQIHQLPGQKIALVSIEEFFPECNTYRSKFPWLSPLQCFHSDCAADRRCMEDLIPRLRGLFAAGVSSELILVYWLHPISQSYFGCQFWADYRDPKVIPLKKLPLDDLLRHSSILQASELNGKILAGVPA